MLALALGLAVGGPTLGAVPALPGSQEADELIVQRLVTLEGHERGVRHADFRPDGRRLATCSDDSTVRTWNVVTGASIAVLSGHRREVATVEYDPTGELLVSASYDGTARVWHLETGETLFVFRGEKMLTGASFSPDGKWVVTSEAAAAQDANGIFASVWNAETGDLEKRWFAGMHQMDVAFRPDSQRLAYASRHVTGAVVDLLSGELLTELEMPETWSTDIDWSANDEFIATAAIDYVIRVFDAKSGRRVHDLRGHRGYCTGVEFSPDSTLLLSHSWQDRTARVWDVERGEQLFVLEGHRDKLLHSTFSPDGKSIATTSSDNTTRVYRADSGNLAGILHGHAESVGFAAFSPDSRRIVTTSADGGARLWSNPVP